MHIARRRPRGAGRLTLWWLGAAAGLALGRRLLRRRSVASLDGKVALVTGGSRGLGLRLARELGFAGCRVAICARNGDELARARDDLAGQGIEVLAEPCDVSRRGDVERLVAVVTERFGPIDLLVNNAGIIQVGPLETMTLEDFEQAMAVNFWGTVYATLAVFPRMRTRRSGRIVNITSIGGKVAVPHLLPYDCAKFAMVGLSEGLRAELGGHGISVTTVVPGLMRTGSFVHALFKGRQERELGWFQRNATSVLTTMNADRAARRIVWAAARREVEITLTWQAKLLRLAHDLFPSTAIRVLAGINRLLPGAEGGSPRAARGGELGAT